MLYKQAMALESKGDLSQAQTIYAQILSQYPLTSSARLDRAAFRIKLTQCKLALQNGDVVSARTYVNQIKTLGGLSTWIPMRLYNTAFAFEQAKFYDDALSLYQEVISAAKL